MWPPKEKLDNIQFRNKDALVPTDHHKDQTVLFLCPDRHHVLLGGTSTGSLSVSWICCWQLYKRFKKNLHNTTLAGWKSLLLICVMDGWWIWNSTQTWHSHTSHCMWTTLCTGGNTRRDTFELHWDQTTFRVRLGHRACSYHFTMSEHLGKQIGSNAMSNILGDLVNLEHAMV